TKPKVSPSSIRKLTSSTALTTVCARNRPPGRTKCLTRRETSMSDISWIVQIAACLMIGPDVVLGRRGCRAPIEATRTPWMKGATVRKRPERRYGAFDRRKPFTMGTSRARREQSTRIRMLRISNDWPYRSLFDDASGVHDGDPIGGFGDHAKIVRNQE